MPTKKKPENSIVIQEVLKKPFTADNIPDFKLSEGDTIPLFSETSIVDLQEFQKLTRKFMAEEDIVVFWGFTGMHASKYSVIKVKGTIVTTDTVETRIKMAKDSQVVNLYRRSGFVVALEKLGGIAGLSPIDFETALLMLDGRIAPPQEEYEEPEEDEFDDDCTDECRPGDHKCGK